MPQQLKISLIILYSLLFFSCEKIINLQLKDTEKQIVIEGSITNRAKQCFVFISHTQPINEESRFNGVSKAMVSISDEHGNTATLSEIEKGVYFNENLKGNYGERYHLKVQLNNRSYTATSTMPPTPVNLDSISVEYNSLYSSYTTSVHFRDPSYEANQYMFIIYKNDRKYNSFFVLNDEYINGKDVKQSLPIFSKEKTDLIYTGDTVKVRMHCIDKNVFKYWYSLNTGAMGGTGGPASFGSPANPVTNIEGGALGYFSAHSNMIKSVIAW